MLYCQHRLINCKSFQVTSRSDTKIPFNSIGIIISFCSSVEMIWLLPQERTNLKTIISSMATMLPGRKDSQYNMEVKYYFEWIWSKENLQARIKRQPTHSQCRLSPAGQYSLKFAIYIRLSSLIHLCVIIIRIWTESDGPTRLHDTTSYLKCPRITQS